MAGGINERNSFFFAAFFFLDFICGYVLRDAARLFVNGVGLSKKIEER